MMGIKLFLYSIIGGLIIGITSCSSAKNGQNLHLTNWYSIDSFLVVSSPLRIVDKGERSGLLVYQKDTFQYMLSHDQTFGPTTARQEFMDAFRGNYYYKFFEYIHFDARFHLKYRDSVELIQIDTFGCHEQTSLYDCKACNACAKMKFKGRYHNFSYIMNKSIFLQPYIVELDTIDQVEIKNYHHTTNKKDQGLVYTSLVKGKAFTALFIKPIGYKGTTSLSSIQPLVRFVNDVR